MFNTTFSTNNVTIKTFENLPGYYELTTAKDKTVRVQFFYGRVFVKNVNRAAKVYGDISMGKKFASIGDAVENYKNADIKHALRVLLSELVFRWRPGFSPPDSLWRFSPPDSLWLEG